MNQTRKKKHRPSKYLVIMSIVLSILCMGLLVFDVVQCREANLILSCEDRADYLEAMTYGATRTEEEIIDYIRREYPTSASDFCLVAKDGEILFMRDENFTKGIDEKKLELHFDLSGEKSQIAGKNVYSVWYNGQRWRLILQEETREDGILTTGICLSESYLISEGDFDILLQHSVLYMALFSIAFIVSIFFLSHREKENALMEDKLTQQLVENRRLIERLGDKLEAQSSMDYRRENGFCPKEVVQGVMEKLSPEQKEKSQKVSIRMLSKEPGTIVAYSVLLERMKVSRSICCLWEEDEFLVLLLNTDGDGASNFIKQFLLQYQKMFQKDASDIRISVKEW